MRRLALIAALLLCATSARAVDVAWPVPPGTGTGDGYKNASGNSVVSAAPFSVFCYVQGPLGIAQTHAAWSVSNSADNSNYWMLYVMDTVAGDPVDFLIKGLQGCRTTNGMTANKWSSVLVIETSATNHVVVLDGDWANRGTSAVSQAPAGVNRVAVGYRAGLTADSWATLSVAYLTLWSVALTQADSDALAAGQHPLMVKSESIVGHWPLFGDGPVGTRVRDSIAAEHLGAVTGSPAKGDMPPIRGPRPQYSHFDTPRIFRPWTHDHAYRRDGYALAA